MGQLGTPRELGARCQPNLTVTRPRPALALDEVAQNVRLLNSAHRMDDRVAARRDCPSHAERRKAVTEVVDCEVEARRLLGRVARHGTKAIRHPNGRPVLRTEHDAGAENLWQLGNALRRPCTARTHLRRTKRAGDQRADKNSGRPRATRDRRDGHALILHVSTVTATRSK